MKQDNIRYYMRYFFALFLIFIITVVGTFAWLNWQSNKIAMSLIINDTRGLTITLRPYQIKAVLSPTNDYTQEPYTEVTVTNKSSISGKFNLYYNVSKIDSELVSSDFKYTVTKSTDGGNNFTPVKTGDFYTDLSGNTIIIYEETVPGKTTNEDLVYKYRVYLYIDGTNELQNDMQNKQFNGELRAQIYDGNVTVDIPDGLIPVKIANNGTVTTVSSTDPTWYNYSEKQWANAVFVKQSGVKTRAQNQVVGTTIDESDILAYYVYIPRYKYSMPNYASCSDISNLNVDEYPDCYDYIDSDTRTFIKYLMSSSGMPQDAAEMCATEATSNYSGCRTYYLNNYNNSYEPDLSFENGVNIEKGVISSNVVKTTLLPVSIKIIFEDKNTPKSTGNAVGSNYRTHPAFTFGDKELNGIWVGKFELAHNSYTSGGIYCYDSSCTYSDGIIIKPNVSSLRSTAIRDYFYVIKSMEKSGNVFGINASVTDSHMIKNSEWGAIAYLSHSRYGINDEVRVNNYPNAGNILTGCGALTSSAESSEQCDNAYGTQTIYPQSTTNNISGIFDLSGGSSEYVMGNVGNYTYYSNFSSMPDQKYYDLYPSNIFSGNPNNNHTFCTLETCGGYALDETYGWYDDFYLFPYSSSPWFSRGGYFAQSQNTGQFGYFLGTGGSDSYTSTRNVIVSIQN